jgi:phosphatidylglycerophosphate synthase
MRYRRPSVDDLRRVTQPARVVGRRSEEHWAGRLYMRRVSVHVTRLAVRLGIGADAVTVLMLVVGLAGSAAVFVGGLWPTLVAVGGIQLYLLLDCVDGEVARWNRTESARGVYLDRISHYLVEICLLAGLGWRAGGGTGSTWLAVGLAAGLGVVLARIETDLIDAARAKAGMAAIGDRGATVRRPALRRIRRLADFFPVHRITGAIEASLLIAGAAVCDRARGDLIASRGVVITMAVVAGLVVVGHLVSVLASDRLR